MLAYIDQASFLGMRALGREPMAQFNWLYEHDVDMDALARFQRNLAHGYLGRLIECSPLPFGRHRWVTPAEPGDLDVSTHECTREQVAAWFDERGLLPIDAEYGPAWHFGVQPLVGGGAALSLVASHSVADALAMCLAVVDAADGSAQDFGYPPPGSRARKESVLEDLRVSARSVQDLGKAIVATVQVARSRNDLVSTAKSAVPKMPTHDAQARFVVPGVTAFVDTANWDERARALGGTSNSLVAGITVRMAQAIGRVDAEGMVKLAFPVSERGDGDIRANALTNVEIQVDPSVATTDLGPIRRDLKSALTELRENPNQLLAPLALTPLIPRRLVRRMERVALGSGMPVGCSNMGDLDPWINRPDGTDAEHFWIRPVEAEITEEIINHINGRLIVASGRINGKVYLSVRAWILGGPNGPDVLRDVLTRTCDEFDLPCVFFE